MILKCDVCKYSANTQRSYYLHCSTKKHKKKIEESTNALECTQNSAKTLVEEVSIGKNNEAVLELKK